MLIKQDITELNLAPINLVRTNTVVELDKAVVPFIEKALDEENINELLDILPQLVEKQGNQLELHEEIFQTVSTYSKATDLTFECQIKITCNGNTLIIVNAMDLDDWEFGFQKCLGIFYHGTRGRLGVEIAEQSELIKALENAKVNSAMPDKLQTLLKPWEGISSLVLNPEYDNSEAHIKMRRHLKAATLKYSMLQQIISNNDVVKTETVDGFDHHCLRAMMNHLNIERDALNVDTIVDDYINN